MKIGTMRRLYRRRSDGRYDLMDNPIARRSILVCVA